MAVHSLKLLFPSGTLRIWSKEKLADPAQLSLNLVLDEWETLTRISFRAVCCCVTTSVTLTRIISAAIVRDSNASKRETKRKMAIN